MRLNSGPRVRPTIGLTPLIDVVFLLLIFFMLASTFLKFSGTPVSGAGSGGTITPVRELALIQVRADNQLTVNGRPVQMETLGDELGVLIGQGVTRGVVRPLAGATVQDLVAVMEIVGGAPLKSVVVVK